MLSPRPQQGPFPRDERTGDARRSSPFDEPRSFAPTADRAPAADGGETLWPSRWRAFSVESPISPANDAAPAGDPQKRALIVIPALNEAKVIASVIARMLDDDNLVDPLVLVADGGSTDGTQDIVRDIAARDGRVRLIDNPGRLQSAGLNLAVRAMAGDRPWIARVDAHADYPRNYVSTLIEEAQRTGAASVVVSMDTKGVDPFQRAVAAAQNSVLGTGGSAHRLATEGKWVDHGHHALFRRDAFQAVGGYDESFSHNEDAELDLRIAKQGGKIWLTDKLRIGYHPRNTAKALAKQYFSYGKGRARTVLKHHTALKVRQALPLAVAPAVLGLIASPLFWWLAAPALAWATICLAYGALLARKAGDWSVLAAGPAAMIMHLAWSAGFWVQLATWRPPKPELVALEKLRALP